jgi:hypothetical protein
MAKPNQAFSSLDSATRHVSAHAHGLEYLFFILKSVIFFLRRDFAILTDPLFEAYTTFLCADCIDYFRLNITIQLYTVYVQYNSMV